MQTRMILVTRVVTAFLFVTAVYGAQPGSKPPIFEVVSIKRSIPSQPGGLQITRRIERPDGGIVLTATSVAALIARAYPGLLPRDFVGLPDWVKSESYDVSATSSLRVATADDRAAMLRAMLADRFQLAVHIEKRSQPVFDLIQANGDGKLASGIERSKTDRDNQPLSPEETPRRPDLAAPPPACSLRSVDQRTRDRFGDRQSRLGDLLEGETTMPNFARALQVFSGRHVVDKTNLAGTYRISMNFNMATTMRGPELAPNARPDVPLLNDAPSLFEALPKQLGLRLKSAEAEVDVLVIDRVNRPTEN